MPEEELTKSLAIGLSYLLGKNRGKTVKNRGGKK